MDPSEQTTGTRDEQYNLVSVLYHALLGAENCNTYALNVEAIGNERLSAFFRDAGVVQARLAGRAKGLLGTPEVTTKGRISMGGSAPPGTEPVEVPPRSAEVQADEISPPARDVPKTVDIASPSSNVVLPRTQASTRRRPARFPIRTSYFQKRTS